MFTPVITGGKKPVYESTTLIPGYHLVGHTVAPGKYTAAPLRKKSGNFVVYRGSSVQANEILGGKNGVASYCMDLQDGDLIYTSGIYVSLAVSQ
jgi:hypothetical protein